jgi:hypothetical protein
MALEKNHLAMCGVTTPTVRVRPVARLLALRLAT